MRSYLQLQKHKWQNKHYKKSMKQYRIHHESDFIKMSIHLKIQIKIPKEFERGRFQAYSPHYLKKIIKKFLKKDVRSNFTFKPVLVTNTSYKFII